MSTDTVNYGFKKDNEDEFYNVNVVNANLDKIDTEMKRIEDTIPTVSPTDSVKWLETVGGTANALTANVPDIESYKNGLAVSFPVNANSTAAMTLNINGLGAIPIKKANGTAFSNAKANGVYTVRYRAGAFILQGESEVENGKQIITPKTTNQAILQGVHDGTGYVEGSPNLIPSNIKSGVNLFNVLGTLRTTANIAIQSITANVYSTTSGPYTSSVLIPGTYKPLYWTCTGIFGSYPEYGSGGGNKYYVETKTATGLSTYVSMVLYGQNQRYVSLSGNVVLRDGKYYFDYSGTGSWDQVDINGGFCTFYINFICET